MLPAAVKEPLAKHLDLIRRQHQRDLERGLGRVALPNALERKYPNAGKEWAWQWVFPATSHYTDLDAMLQEIRTSRSIRPPTMWCPVCNQRTQQAPPSVSVRATILALGRFGIVAAAEVKSLEKRWAKHRKENSLDRNDKLSEALSTASAPHGPDCQSHDPTL